MIIFRSIVVKLWLAMTLMILLASAVLAWYMGQSFEDFYFAQKEDDLVDSAKRLVIARAAADLGSETSPSDITEEMVANLTRFIGERLDALVIITSASGEPRNVYNPNAYQKNFVDPTDVVERIRPWNGLVTIQRGPHPRFANSKMISVAYPIYRGREINGGVFIFKQVEPITEQLNSLYRSIAMGAGLIIALETLLAFVLSASVSRPLLAMNRIARGMAHGDFSGKVKVGSLDEIGTLGRTLNSLSSQLQHSLDALSREKDLMANVLSSMTDGVVTFRPDGRVILANAPAAGLLGYDGPLPSGRPLPDGPDAAELYRLVEQVTASGSPIAGEIGRESRHVAVRMAPLKRSSGDVGGIVAVLQDVTRERQLEQMRRDFVSDVSHELRTPLSFIQGYSEALLDGLDRNPEQRRSYLQIIVEETVRLKRLVTNLLDLSLLEAGRFKPPQEPFSLAGVLKRAMRAMEPMAGSLGVAIKAEGAVDLPPALGDEDRIEQVLINLMDNALRHTPAGGWVTVSVRPSPGLDAINIDVADTGEGIPPGELPRIWERFYKVDKARTRSHGGTGLGLSIVKSIVSAHGGEVTVESTPGLGTTFHVVLPSAARTAGEINGTGGAVTH